MLTKQWVTVVAKCKTKCSNVKTKDDIPSGNSGEISLVLVKLLGEEINRLICSLFTILNKNSTKIYVTGMIYGQHEFVYISRSAGDTC